MSEKTHRAICGAAIAAGVLVRLARLTSLPAGISAEEALVAGQSTLADGRLLLRAGADDPAFAMVGRDDRAVVGRADRAVRRSVRPEQKLTVRLPLALLSLRGDAGGLRTGRGAFRQARGALDADDCRALPDFRAGSADDLRLVRALYLLPVRCAWCAQHMETGGIYPGMIVLALTAYAQDMSFLHRSGGDSGLRDHRADFRQEKAACGDFRRDRPAAVRAMLRRLST